MWVQTSEGMSPGYSKCCNIYITKNAFWFKLLFVWFEAKMLLKLLTAH